MRQSLPDVQIVEDDVKSPTRRKRLSLKVVKDRSYFTESARFKLTKLTTTFLMICSKNRCKDKHAKALQGIIQDIIDTSGQNEPSNSALKMAFRHLFLNLTCNRALQLHKTENYILEIILLFKYITKT